MEKSIPIKEFLLSRSIKELLQIVLDNMKSYNFQGLCSFCFHLYCCNIITNYELSLLHNYIKNNKPINFRTLTRTAYYWRRDKIYPRVKWLKKHIQNENAKLTKNK